MLPLRRKLPLGAAVVFAHTCFADISPPQSFKPCRIGRRIPDGVLNIPVSQIIWSCPSIAWMKGRRSDVDHALVEPGVQVP